MLIARYNSNYSRYQTLKDHCRNTAKTASETLAHLNLPSLGYLAGFLHDIGKSTPQWQSAIKKENKFFDETRKAKSAPLDVPHAPVSAALIYNLLSEKSKSAGDKSCLQVLCMAVYAHHGYLADALSVSGEETFYCLIDKFNNKNLPAFDSYFEEILCKNDIFSLWEKAKTEFSAMLKKINNICKDIECKHSKHVQMLFITAMLTRLVYSALIDADRLDAQVFEESNTHIPCGSVFSDASAALEKYIEKLEGQALVSKQNKDINNVRSQISSLCKNAASSHEKLFSLHAPTGSGKTLAGLRWAVNKAKLSNRKHIFYIVSYTTILDQVYSEYKTALSGCNRQIDILLHHSNIIDESEDTLEQNTQESLDADRLAERWKADIILTTQVQFFNALFLGTGRAARRMQSLQNSVIIFDEVQTIPPKLSYLFNLSIRYLTEIADCDILLSSATQADFENMKYPTPPIKSIFENPDNLFEKMRRVKLIDNTSEEALSPHKLALFAAEKQKKFGSLLIVVNTRKAALDTYEAIKELELPGAEIMLLSNNLCPAHRHKIISRLKESSSQNAICVSTQLIECGVDLSFACVIRSLAGTDSMWQAAGRCNRHGEREISPVYIVRLNYENLNFLPEIKDAQYASEKLFHYLSDVDLLQRPSNMKQYYTIWMKEQNIESQLAFPIKINSLSSNLVDMLSLNKAGQINFSENNNGARPKMVNKQAFSTAGKNFNVIDSGAKSIIVPYAEGEEIINQLFSFTSLHKEKALLRKAQLYSVNIYDYSLKNLDNNNALCKLPCGALALKSEWYDNKTGLLYEPIINADKYIF